MPSLLIAGGLTIDRFTDGSTAPGGSVIHAGGAAVRAGGRLSILTVAGDEPEARRGVEMLERLGSVERRPSASTTTYRHEEDADGRRLLVYEAASAVIEVGSAPQPVDVLLVAPIAHELPGGAVAALRSATDARLVVLLVQGWLRHLRVGEPVRPMALDEVGAELWTAFGTADVVIVSSEDYRGQPDDPFAQAAALRARVGPKPILVVTLGTDGYVLDDPGADRIVAAVPRRVVVGAPTVGAGDTFGAAMAVRLAAGGTPAQAADAGTEAVIALLESRLA
jgi:sugar/nucleoside kinase (ribokinase family)